MIIGSMIEVEYANRHRCYQSSKLDITADALLLCRAVGKRRKRAVRLLGALPSIDVNAGVAETERPVERALFSGVDILRTLLAHACVFDDLGS